LQTTMNNFIRISIASLLFVTIFCSVHSARAQETETTFDTEGKLATLTPEMESEAQLFPDAVGFKEARLFSLPDSSYTLEITSEHDGKTVHTRKSLTRNQRDSLSARLLNKLVVTHPSLLLDQTGRADFLVGMGVLSLGVYGPSIAAMTSSRDGGTAVGIWLLSAGGGYLIPSSMTSNATVTRAQASLGIAAGVEGYMAGLVLSDLAHSTTEGFAGISTVISIGDLAAMYSIAGSTQMSEGKAVLMGGAGLDGMLDGYAIGGLIDNSSELSGAKEGGIILGHVVGYIAGNAIANRANYTSGDASGINLLANLGYLTGLVNVGLANTDIDILRNQPAFVSALVGNVAGYYIGSNLLRNYSLTNAEGTYLGLGVAGGALIGFGIGFLADSKTETPVVTSLLATVGAIGGFAGVLLSIQKSPVSSDHSELKVNVNPAGLLGALNLSNRSNSSIIDFQYRW
jgi:hypothetical protein